MHDKMDILDENENVVYRVASKALSIHDKTHITDASGHEIAYLHAKAVSIHQVHYVETPSGENFKIKLKLGHPFHNQLDIKELGWKILGEFSAHDYKILDEFETVLAKAHRKWFSMHSIYYLDIYDENKKELILAASIVLEHILSNQDAAANTRSKQF